MGKDVKMQRRSHSVKTPYLFVRDAAFAVAPVVVGACFVMWYNYVRFDSITEFGQLMQITGDNIPANALSLELSFLIRSLSLVS